MHKVDQVPDIDPVLSSGAKKLRVKKLDSLPWSHSGIHPGSAMFWNVILVMLRVAWSYIFRSKEIEKLHDFEGGRVLSSTHINGLVDPMALIIAQDRRIISMGRHDIMTMPLVGWFARRMGSQPVIRRSEINAGISGEEYATKINHRTLLTMSNCLASGHNAIVMPEGKSHQDSRLHKFRTGAFRFALNAAVISKERGLPGPALQPIGLHYRCHYWFRTDVFVECPPPIPIESPTNSQVGMKLLDGKWLEPESESVIRNRDLLFQSLAEIGPEAPDWETYRSWHLIGHIRANKSGRGLRSFREEVLAARDVRRLMGGCEDPTDILKPAISASEILHANNLDGRSIDGSSLKDKKSWTSLIAGLLICIAVSPLVLISTGCQAFLAWFLGDRTDEGVDARTTYHLLAAMFSPVLIWPPIAIVGSLLLVGNSIVAIPLAIGMMFAFHICNLLFLLGYDLIMDFTKASRVERLAKSEDGERLEILLSEIVSNLNLLLNNGSFTDGHGQGGGSQGGS